MIFLERALGGLRSVTIRLDQEGCSLFALRRPTFRRAAINPPHVSSYFSIRMAGFIGIHLLGLDPRDHPRHMHRSLWHDAPIFRHVATQSIDHLGRLLHQEIARPEHDGIGLLVLSILRPDASRRAPLCSFQALTESVCLPAVAI
jgi:hypothetical protein